MSMLTPAAHPAYRASGVNEDVYRIAFFILIIAALPLFRLFYSFGEAADYHPVVMVALVGLWLILLSATAPFVTFYVPGLYWAVTMNTWSGKLRIWSSGIRFRWPFDKVVARVKFEIFTGIWSGTFVTKDGPTISLEGFFLWGPAPRGLPQYLREQETGSVEQGFGNGMLRRCFRSRLAHKKILDTQAAIEELQEESLRAFRPGAAGAYDPLEEFGIEMRAIVIAGSLFDEAYQRMRTSIKISGEMLTIARAYERRKMPLEQAVNTILLLNGTSNVERKLFGLEGDGAAAAGAALMALVGSRLSPPVAA